MLLPYYGPTFWGRRVRTSLIETHLKPVCAQIRTPLGGVTCPRQEILLESGLLRGREIGSLLVHALYSYRYLFLPHSRLSYFLYLSSLFFPISLFSVFSLLLFLLLVVYCARLRPFYTACCDKIYHPLNYFWPVVGVLLELSTGLLAAQPPPLPCVGRTMLYFQTKVVLFCFFFFASFGTPIQIKAEFFSY